MDLMVNYLQEKYSVSVLFSVYGYKQTVSNSDTRKNSVAHRGSTILNALTPYHQNV